MRYFSVKNWSEFQHYKDRSPPWIKLHSTVVDDYEFGCLQDASKAHLILIWSLASRNGNRLPFDARWIAAKINATSPVDLEALEDKGFIVCDTPREQRASDLLSDCLSRGEERRGYSGEAEEIFVKSADADARLPQTNIVESNPTADAVAVYNATATDCGWPVCQKLTQSRKVKLMARVQDAGGMDGWRKAMGLARKSKFLRGEKRGNGHEEWRPSIDFFLQQSSFTKLLEGAYGAELDVTKTTQDPDAVRWKSRIAGWRKTGFWNCDLWGPKPGEPGSKAPIQTDGASP